ncbi:MAG: hypothetical protein J5697_01660 [Clostridia bacterium]|nr:hypothetical protein [Clostridia bacterium]
MVIRRFGGEIMMDVKKKLSITSFIIFIIILLACASACKKNEESTDSYEFTPLTVSVFADVQLERENVGNTRNAYLSLKNHLKYSKSIGAEVVFMPGDVVNKADETCYEAYERAICAVYGDDENDYPEFIYCMGNHEWWGPGEKDVGTAVSLFEKHARINTDCLVKKSEVKYYLDKSTTLPTYYKVIKGIPFIVISGNDSSGRIESDLKKEIAEWLKEISNLPSVKAGGPIIVAYHYPIQRVTYKGENAGTHSAAINELFKDYPSAIVFTGDTHFNGVNERTINQVNFTAINIGSSSYSRNMSLSAANYQYDNVNLDYKDKNLLTGESGFKCEYTATMHVINVEASGKTSIDRYYTADKPEDAVKLGLTWVFPLIKDKSEFIYTNERIENRQWANKLYGKDGLIWADGEKVGYNVENGKMFVSFNDVTDYNCAEHYRIEIKDAFDGQNVKYYDFTGHYYKYDKGAHSYHFVLEDIPLATEYSVKVTAYDFFDNPSLNELIATEEDETLLFPDEIDVKAAETYSDISRRVNYDVTVGGSNSSVEYYYRGISAYSGGMMLCQFVFKEGLSIKDQLSVTDWSNAKLTVKVKNPNDFDIYFGLDIIVKESNSQQRVLDDFSSSRRIKAEAGSDWLTIEWDLNSEYGYHFNSDIIERITLKVSADQFAVDNENGYEMSFYIDDIDIID